MIRNFNAQYGVLWATYWMNYGVINVFCSMFLLDKGYSNYAIGMVFTISAILSVIIQPPIANVADNSKRFTLHKIIEIMALATLIFTACLFGFHGKNPLLIIIYTTLITIILSMHGFINSIKGRAEKAGINVNYGLDRSMGSVGYSLLMAVLGGLVEKYSVGILPIFGIATIAIFLIYTVINDRTLIAFAIKNFKEDRGTEVVATEEEEIGLMAFLFKNKAFLVMCVGVVLAYVSNQVLNNYMLQIIRPLGGDSQDLGLVCGIMAALEIPTMVFYANINKKFSNRLLVKVGAIGFAIKSLLFTIAPNMTFIYLADLSQPIAYALLLPAMVHYIDEIMEPREAVKGQASFVTATVVGSIVASLSGGILLDLFGPKAMMGLATVLGTIGAVIMIMAINRIPARKTHKEEM